MSQPITRDEDWEVLPGLPPYGPTAETFSETGQGAHREGFVVRFHLRGGDSWVGNFQRGLSSRDEVLRHPDRHHVLVVAGGTAYVVDAGQRKLVRVFGSDTTTIFVVPEIGAVVFGNGLWFEAIARDGLLWRTRRISWDEMRGVACRGTVLHGEASGLESDWHRFEVDLRTGEVCGGSYSGPPM